MNTEDGTKLAAWGILAVGIAGLFGAVTNESWLSVLGSAVNPKTPKKTLDSSAPALDLAANSDTSAGGGSSASNGNSTTATVAGSRVAKALAFAKAQLGEPYVWAGAGPDHWDCSGLTMKAFEAAGYNMPHNAELQMQQTKKYRIAKTTSPPPGALCFFGTGGFAEHVGISDGGGRMIEAPHTGDVVKYYGIAAEGDLIMVTDPLGVLDQKDASGPQPRKTGG